MSFIVPLNITAPSTLTFRILSPLTGADLSTVTAGSLNVIRRDGSTATWALTIVSSSPAELVAQYQFAGNELNTTGAYALQPMLTLPGGTIPSQSVSLFVTSPSACAPQLEAKLWQVATSIIGTPGPSRQGWAGLVSAASYTASPIVPWVPLDLRAGAISVHLWAANDAENIVLVDVYRAAGAHSMTLIGAGSQLVPVGDGTYSGSAVNATAGFMQRLKYNAAMGLWIGW